MHNILSLDASNLFKAEKVKGPSSGVAILSRTTRSFLADEIQTWMISTLLL